MVDALRFDDSAPQQIFADSVWYNINPFEITTLGIDLGAATSIAIEWRDSNDENVTRTLATFTASDGINVEGGGQLRKVDTGGASVVVGVGITRGTE